MQGPRATPELLRRVPYFGGLGEAARAELSQRVRARSYGPGETIIVEGWPCEGLFFVIRGHVRLFRSGADGRRQVLRVAGPGRTFNDAAAFDGGANAEGAVAVDHAIVGLVPAATLRLLLEQHPEVARAAIRGLAARERALGQMVQDLALSDVTARIAKLLLGCAGRHEHMVEGGPEACARITHHEVAAMVGSVREVVQRVLKAMEAAGAIKLERARIRILDADKLERFSKASEG